MTRTTLLLGLLLIPAISVTGLTRNEIVTPDEHRRLVIGVHIADLGAPLAAQLNLERQRGIVITHVVPGQPADQAGVQQYDVITAVQGQSVTSRSSLARALDQLEAGDAVVLTLLRQARVIEIGVEVIAGPVADVRRDALEALEALGYVGGRTDAARQDKAAEPTAEELTLEQRLMEQRRREQVEQQSTESVALEALARRNGVVSDTARRLLEAGESLKARQSLELQDRVAVMSDNLRILQESLTHFQSRKDRALEQLHAEAATISDRLHRHLKELLTRHKNLSDEEVVQAEASMQEATQALHNAIASVHDRLTTREMQILERENSLPDVVVTRGVWRPGTWAQDRTEPDPDLEDRLRSIDERLARIEQALEEMRKRRTD